MSSLAITRNRSRTSFWPWLMCGIAFIIATLFPPLNFPINYSLIPGLLQPLVVYGVQGGIGWQLLHYIQEDAVASYSLGELFVLIAPFCTVPLFLTLSAILTWRRVVNRSPRPTVRRGLLAAVLATVFALLTIVVLDLLILGPFALFTHNEGNLLGLIIFALAALAQSLWVLPALLLAGALLAALQARSRAV